MTVRVGLIGAGMIGSEHARRICEQADAEVVAVSDVDSARAHVLADGFLGARVFESGESLIADRDVDAVLITSSGPTHARYVLASIAAQKPTFCEKPLGVSQAECERIVRAEIDLGRRILQVGYMRRYDCGYLAMKKTVDAGCLGRPTIVHSAHRNPSVPSSYTREMAIVDTAVHDIDVVRWLLGEDFVTVSALTPRHNRRTAENLADPVVLLLSSESGVLVDIEIQLNIGYGYDIRGEIVCENGVIQLSDSGESYSAIAGQAGQVPSNWQQRFARAFDTEIAEWIRSVSVGLTRGPSSWDGYRVSVTSDAALEALSTGAAIPVDQVSMPDIYQGG